jgi:hypothetical protein
LSQSLAAGRIVASLPLTCGVSHDHSSPIPKARFKCEVISALIYSIIRFIQAITTYHVSGRVPVSDVA